MYQVTILYGMVDADGKAFERVLDKCDLLASNDDLAKAKAEAETFSLWEEHTASYHAAAKVADELPEWKQHTVDKKRVYDLKYTERPIAERPEGQYVIVRISKV